MGIDSSFEAALAKAYMAAGYKLPTEGKALISVKDDDKEYILSVAQMLEELGFEIYATKGTALYLNNNGIAAEAVNKVREGRPHIVDMLKDGKINLVINTSKGVKSVSQLSSINTPRFLFKYIATSPSKVTLSIFLSALVSPIVRNLSMAF